MPSSKQNKVHIIIQAMRVYHYITAKGVLNWQRTHPHARTYARTHTHTHHQCKHMYSVPIKFETISYT